MLYWKMHQRIRYKRSTKYHHWATISLEKTSQNVHAALCLVSVLKRFHYRPKETRYTTYRITTFNGILLCKQSHFDLSQLVYESLK